MKRGADRKKLVFLGVLVVLGAYLFYTNVLSGPSAAPDPARPAHALQHSSPRPLDPSASETAAPVRRASMASRSGEEFRPSLKPKRPEDRVDPMTIDPTLRTDLLAQVQAVPLEGGARNLFKMGQPPPPPLPPEQKIVPGRSTGSAPPPKPVPPPAPSEAQAPPITLKYYGYSSARADDRKQAFFLDGDDILVASEGELVKKRYRVVRIGVNSVVMEDVQFKHEQTLPLQEEAQG